MYTRDHNCLSWALSQVLGENLLKVLPWETLYNLDFEKEIGHAFQEKAWVLGVKSRRLDDNEVEEALHLTEHSEKMVIAVFGYYTVECNHILYTEYENSGFHIALCKKGVWLHKLKWGIEPDTISIKELQKAYGNPIYFEVEKKNNAG